MANSAIRSVSRVPSRAQREERKTVGKSYRRREKGGKKEGGRRVSSEWKEGDSEAD